MRRMKQLAILLAVVVAAACGGDDDRALTADEQAVADDLADEFIADFTGVEDNRLITDDEGACYGEKVVRSIGLDAADELLEQELADEFSMSRRDATEVAEALVSCVDLEALYRDGLVGLLEGDDLDCAAERLADLGPEPFVVELTGEVAGAAFDDIAEECDLPF